MAIFKILIPILHWEWAKENGMFFLIYEKENSSIAVATVVFYFKVERKKKHFIGLFSILNWYNNFNL